MPDRGVRAGDRALSALEKRIIAAYKRALQVALENEAAFFEKIKRMDYLQTTLPARYTPEMIQKWREGFALREANYREVTRNIARLIAATGGDVGETIKQVMSDIYGINRNFTIDRLAKVTLQSNFAMYDANMIRIAIEDAQSPFSKIAYNNLGKEKIVVDRLNDQLLGAIVNGESQRELLQRIKDITGQSVWQARRVAQTERTRVQSQARLETLEEAKRLGVNVQKKWTARMVRTRETHADLNGKVVGIDEPFITIHGNSLMYPGDYNAPASEVCNCHCVLIPIVGEAL